MDYDNVGEVLPPRPYIESTLDVFVRYLHNSDRILDLGCRDGYSCEYLIERGYRNVVGIERFEPFVQHAQEMGRPIRVGDAEDLDFEDDSFDAVFSRHCLEHLRDPLGALREAYRILKEDGITFLTVPMEDKPSEKDYHLCCFPTLKNLEEIFRKANFEIAFIGLSKEKGIAPIGNEALVIARKCFFPIVVGCNR